MADGADVQVSKLCHKQRHGEISELEGTGEFVWVCQRALAKASMQVEHKEGHLWKVKLVAGLAEAIGNQEATRNERGGSVDCNSKLNPDQVG